LAVEVSIELLTADVQRGTSKSSITFTLGIVTHLNLKESTSTQWRSHAPFRKLSKKLLNLYRVRQKVIPCRILQNLNDLKFLNGT